MSQPNETRPDPHTIMDDWRVLPPTPHRTLEDYIAAGGGEGLRAARAVEPDVVLGELAASGLRGRGGAGFPTAEKWRTVAGFAADALATPVVVNAAEGEPGTYKDRAILLANPYAVLEGALIAARVVGAREVTVATKERFTEVVTRVRSAIREIEAAGWNGDVTMSIVTGPAEYLYGEETALLEVLDGRPPFPRIAPPWRRGNIEVVRSDEDVTSGSGVAAEVVMATPSSPITDSEAPPTLVNNVETMANVPAIIAKGAAWFRSLGTDESPGTVVCTVTGDVRHPVVVEVPMGVSLRSVIDRTIGHGDADESPRIAAVMLGVSNPILHADLDVPVSYEAMRARGTALGSASFIVVDERTDPVALAAGVSRFLAIESCGQCTPCKQDGLEIAARLRAICTTGGTDDDLAQVQKRLDTITTGARCNLATQHQLVVGSILDAFSTRVELHLGERHQPVEPALIAELLRIDDDTVTLDEDLLRKQPDWTLSPDAEASLLETSDVAARTPVDRLTDHRKHDGPQGTAAEQT